MAETASGKFTEIIFVRFQRGEDLRQGLLKVIKEKNIKTGAVLSITGALEKATLQRFSQVGDPTIMTEVIEVAGPLEASGHGIIGQIESPAFGKTPFGPAKDLVDGEPYLHLHITVTSAEQTVCGHLLDGSPVRSIEPVSHFIAILGRIDGVIVKMIGEPGAKDKPGSFHMRNELVQL